MRLSIFHKLLSFKGSVLYQGGMNVVRTPYRNKSEEAKAEYYFFHPNINIKDLPDILSYLNSLDIIKHKMFFEIHLTTTKHLLTRDEIILLEDVMGFREVNYSRMGTREFEKNCNVISLSFDERYDYLWEKCSVTIKFSKE